MYRVGRVSRYLSHVPYIQTSCGLSLVGSFPATTTCSRGGGRCRAHFSFHHHHHKGVAQCDIMRDTRCRSLLKRPLASLLSSIAGQS